MEELDNNLVSAETLGPEIDVGSEELPSPEIDVESGEVSEPEIDAGSDDGIVLDGAFADMLYQAVYDANIDSYAVNAQVTDGQTLNSSAISFFQGVLENKILPVDYVAFVGSPYEYYQGNQNRMAYEYCLAVGDFELNGTNFSGDDVTLYKLRLSGDVSANVEQYSEYDIDAPLYYSRSNLGQYAGIVKYDYISLGILVGLVFGGVVWFVRKLLQVSY